MVEQLVPDKPGEWLYVDIGAPVMIAHRARVDWRVFPLHDQPVLAARFVDDGGPEMWHRVDGMRGIRWAGRALTDGELVRHRLGLEVE
jgi:hypothetical protein